MQCVLDALPLERILGAFQQRRQLLHEQLAQVDVPGDRRLLRLDPLVKLAQLDVVACQHAAPLGQAGLDHLHLRGGCLVARRDAFEDLERRKAPDSRQKAQRLLHRNSGLLSSLGSICRSATRRETRSFAISEPAPSCAIISPTRPRNRASSAPARRCVWRPRLDTESATSISRLPRAWASSAAIARASCWYAAASSGVTPGGGCRGCTGVAPPGRISSASPVNRRVVLSSMGIRQGVRGHRGLLPCAALGAPPQ